MLVKIRHSLCDINSVPVSRPMYSLSITTSSSIIHTVVIFPQAGADQWGTEEADINAVLCRRNVMQLRATFQAYQEIAGQDIKEAIESECSGSLQDGYIAISKSCYTCFRYHETM